MKKLFTLLSIITLVYASATAQVTPKKNFTLAISETNITVLPGETKQFDVTILRSKSFSKTDISLVMDSTLPNGVEITFIDGTNPMVNQIMQIAVAKDATPVKKMLILKGKSNRFSKAVMLNVTISDGVYSASK